mmetsp:Transcript_25594/g.84257  ORF Transcript_25594/g.84257 Transcript_25594/m.84257 type:complete len:392 (-) Transcript_25594:35-1210(-)
MEKAAHAGVAPGTASVAHSQEPSSSQTGDEACLPSTTRRRGVPGVCVSRHLKPSAEGSSPSARSTPTATHARGAPGVCKGAFAGGRFAHRIGNGDDCSITSTSHTSQFGETSRVARKRVTTDRSHESNPGSELAPTTVSESCGCSSNEMLSVLTYGARPSHVNQTRRRPLSVSPFTARESGKSVFASRTLSLSSIADKSRTMSSAKRVVPSIPGSTDARLNVGAAVPERSSSERRSEPALMLECVSLKRVKALPRRRDKSECRYGAIHPCHIADRRAVMKTALSHGPAAASERSWAASSLSASSRSLAASAARTQIHVAGAAISVVSTGFTPSATEAAAAAVAVTAIAAGSPPPGAPMAASRSCLCLSSARASHSSGEDDSDGPWSVSNRH